eukprot:9454217-Lingulodinium_polyedra.AAC.1
MLFKAIEHELLAPTANRIYKPNRVHGIGATQRTTRGPTSPRGPEAPIATFLEGIIDNCTHESNIPNRLGCMLWTAGSP